MNWYIAGILLYILTLVGISIYASRKVNNEDDFHLAGRSMSFWLLAFTFAGLWFGGGTVIGATGVAFEMGFWSSADRWGVISDPYGAGLCLIMAGLFYFGTIRKIEGITLADFFEAKFGKRAGLLSAVVMIFGWTFFVASQVVVFGKIFNSILGWPYELSIWIGVTLVIIYTITGGLWSVALTNIVQISIILIGILFAVPVGLKAIGGLAEIKAVLPPEMLSFTPPRLPGMTASARWLPWISAWMIIGLGSIATPDINQVAQSGATDKDVKYASVTAGLIYWIFGTLLVLLGLIGAALVARGTIAAELLQGDSEMILPVMVQNLFPLPLAIIMVAAILSAVVSSADGALLALATLFTRNILPLVLPRNKDEKKQLGISRIVVIVFAVLTTVIGISYPHAFLLMNFGFDSLLAGLFVPLTLALYWKGIHTAGFFSGVITGILVRVILSGLLEGWSLEMVMYPEKWYIYTLAAPLANLAVTILVSLTVRTKVQTEKISEKT